MRDPYQVLGIGRDAAEAEVKRAFRKLAKQWHPDRNRDDPTAQDRFSELNSAYEILGEPEKRAAFDRGEIGADGKPRFQGFEGFARRGGAGAGRPSEGASSFEFGMGSGGQYGRGGPFDRGHPGGGPGGPGFDPGQIFRDLFGEAMQRGAGGAGPGAGASAGARMKGNDVTAELSLSLEELARGGTRPLRLSGGRTVTVDIPLGVSDSQTIRLRGLGEPSPLGGAPGDALLTIKLKPHARFTVEGANLRQRIAVPLADAVLGGTLRVPTLEGAVEMSLQPMSSGGRVLRLRGKGLPMKDAAGRAARGDLLVVLDIELPAKSDPELDALMRKWRGG